MRIRIPALIFLLTICCTLAACATTPDAATDATITIIARRLGYHSIQMKPELFEPVADLAERSCKEISKDVATPDVAFQLIAQAIANYTSDPLILKDLTDLVKIMGLDLNQAYQVLNLDSRTYRLLRLFICSYAEGAAQARKE